MAPIIAWVVTLVMSLFGMASFAHWAKLGQTNVVTAINASENQIYNKAAAQYVQDHAATIAAEASATVPVTISTTTMIAGGYLPTGFSTTNTFGQAWELQVLQPSSGQLESLVTSQGGTAISNETQLVQIAAQTGAQGGFVPYANQAGDATMSPSNAYGALGAWKIALSGFTNPGAGHLASLLAFTNVTASNNYLYRNAMPAAPQLNDMQTDLGMTDVSGVAHNITGANQISGQSLEALSAGTMAVPSVTLANGNVVSWDQVSEGGVLGLKGANGQSVYLESLNGTFRLVNNAMATQVFSVDQSGNVVAGGNVSANGYLKAGNIAYPEASCTQIGAKANDSDGSGFPLTCENYVWVPDGGRFQTVATYVVVNGTVVPAPTCAAGGTGEIYLSSQNIYIDTTATSNFGPASGSGPWTISITDGSGTPVSGSGMADVKCRY